MKVIHTLSCRELCNLLPDFYPTSRTQMSLAPTSTCYAECFNTREVLNCIFRSKVMWWLQIRINYRPCFRNMEIQATQHLHSTGTNSSYGKMYSERLDNTGCGRMDYHISKGNKKRTKQLTVKRFIFSKSTYNLGFSH